MKIEKLNENKIKIIFDYKELEENNISVHSFLANSLESQKLFLAILDIAKEDLGFDITNSQISYETLSFDNKNFVILVTKKVENCKDIFFNFVGDRLINSNFPNSILYKFKNMDDVFSFSEYIHNLFSALNFKSSLYEYNNIYFIKIDIQHLDLLNKKKTIYFLSELKDCLKVSDLSVKRLEEFGNILIKDNAFNRL